MSRLIGQRLPRREDARLLTGRALFTDDVDLPGMLHAAFLRSPVGHARVKRLDLSRARARNGVVAVYGADDLGALWGPGPLLVPPPPIEDIYFVQRTIVPLAKDKVRHMGEPVAMVIATSRYVAEDALEDIVLELEPLPAVLDLEAALERDAARVHEDLPNNLASHVVQTKGDYEAALAEAPVVLKRRFRYDRGVAAALENRGVVAEWDAKGGVMRIWDTTQAPIPIRNGVAGMLGLSESQVQVVAPFIGGGFGPKMMMFYPEEILVPWASRQLGRPVKWIEDRRENFGATTQERLQIHDSEIALTKDGVILGVKDVFLHDSGAYNSYGLTIPINSQCTLLGQYNIPNYYSEFKVVFTNRVLVTPYRGAGRQHGVFVIERLLDFAARELGIDRAEIRRRNLIRPEHYPYDNELIYQDFAPLVYDSGDVEPVLDKALDMIGYDDFIRNEQPAARAEGRHLGLGLVCYTEGTGIGPYEGARVRVESTGRVSVATGVGTQGQGHYTSLAQVVAEPLGLSLQDVDITTGDTTRFHWGTGTFASRGAVVAGNACYAAAQQVRQKVVALAAKLLRCLEEDVEVSGGRAFIHNHPDKGYMLSELAALANPLRGAVEPGTEPGLEATAYFGPPRGATANGIHAAIVEVDPETLQVQTRKYVVVHDCGTVLNPLLLEGQVHGGVAQGLGNAWYEELDFDEQGRILNNNLHDFMLPTAQDIPPIDVGHEETRSPLNPLGVKGAGEAGAIPGAAVFVQAVEDALGIDGLELRDVPLSPAKLLHILSEHTGG
ncbi:MAG: xanthine dehydrogenase family protein [Alphaproteobacteria bacterium]|nr:xanthine dehydrogenase family protein [Alphaproteobacteria bacterium]